MLHNRVTSILKKFTEEESDSDDDDDDEITIKHLDVDELNVGFTNILPLNQLILFIPCLPAESGIFFDFCCRLTRMFLPSTGLV